MSIATKIARVHRRVPAGTRGIIFFPMSFTGGGVGGFSIPIKSDLRKLKDLVEYYDFEAIRKIPYLPTSTLEDLKKHNDYYNNDYYTSLKWKKTYSLSGATTKTFYGTIFAGFATISAAFPIAVFDYTDTFQCIMSVPATMVALMSTVLSLQTFNDAYSDYRHWWRFKDLTFEQNTEMYLEMDRLLSAIAVKDEPERA